MLDMGSTASGEGASLYPSSQVYRTQQDAASSSLAFPSMIHSVASRVNQTQNTIDDLSGRRMDTETEEIKT